MAIGPINPAVLEPGSGALMVPENARMFAGLKVQSAKFVVNNGLCLTLFGQGGAGKTTTAAMISKSNNVRKACHIDVEGGASSIAHLEDVDTVSIAKWSELQGIGNVYRDLKKEQEPPYDTLIFDNMSEIQNLSIQSIAGSNQPEIQHWGKMTADMLRLVRFWRDQARYRGINVIFIAWEEVEKEESTGKWKRHLFFTPKLAAQVPGIVTMIGHVSVLEGNKDQMRKLSFAPSDKTDAKFRVAPNEAASAIPLELYYKRDDAVLADILDTIRGDIKWPTARYAAPQRATS